MISRKLIKNHIYYKIEQTLKKHITDEEKVNKIRDELFNELKLIVE